LPPECHPASACVLAYRLRREISAVSALSSGGREAGPQRSATEPCGVTRPRIHPHWAKMVDPTELKALAPTYQVVTKPGPGVLRMRWLDGVQQAAGPMNVRAPSRVPVAARVPAAAKAGW